MLVVSVTAMVFTSCSSDDDGSKGFDVQEVLGTWICTASTDKVGGQTITGYMVGKTITFKGHGVPPKWPIHYHIISNRRIKIIAQSNPRQKRVSPC